MKREAIAQKINKLIFKYKIWVKRGLPIGEVKTKEGVSYGFINTNDIDTVADYKTLFTMYSTMMHELNRSNMDYGKVYQRWTDDYDDIISCELFKNKDYCLRCGEAIRYHFAQQAGIEFTPKYVLTDDAKWIVNVNYIYGIWFINDEKYLNKLKLNIGDIEECFAKYKIAFQKVDEAA